MRITSVGCALKNLHIQHDWKDAIQNHVNLYYNWKTTYMSSTTGEIYSAYNSCLNKASFISNWPNFTMLFYYIKLPPHSSCPGSTLALTGALNWGTVWTSTSTGTGIVKGQSLSNQIYFTKTHDQVWPFTIPVSVKGELHTVPHFKAPVIAKVGPGGLKCGGTFRL